MHFALMLFAGMIVFSMFSEVVGRAPIIIMQNANYVKRVIFPVVLLPLVVVGSAGFQALVALALLLIAVAVQVGLGPAALTLPVILLPYLILLFGLGLILAALGTYLKDLGQILTMVTVALQFLSPVFYPVSALPSSFQVLMRFNPVTYPIETVRLVILNDQWPDWIGLIQYSIAAIFIAALGLWFFGRVKRGFADVL